MNLIGHYKVGHTELFRVHRRNILLHLTQRKRFDFPSLS